MIAARRCLIGQEKSGAYLMTSENAGDQLGIPHVAGIQREIHLPPALRWRRGMTGTAAGLYASHHDQADKYKNPKQKGSTPA